ncbi:MAG: hypothetical protein ACHQ49_06400 [Elusimicrobiota bacterium]
MTKRHNPKLDNEEKELLRSVDSNLEKRRKIRRVSFQLSQLDLELMQRFAVEDGIPYQTLMARVIQRYVNDYVSAKSVEKRPAKR